jgi:uncharacterized protein YkwD
MRNIPRLSLLVLSSFLFVLVFGSLINGQGPAKNVVAPDFLSPLESEVITEINLARANPGKYVAYLEECRKYYNGKSYLPPSRTKPVTTWDGVAALDEAIKFLQTKEPLGPLQASRGLSFGARDHTQDMVQKGTSGHRGSDGSLPNDRISRYGTWKSTVGEAILYRVSTAREMVLDLIVDDGNPGRPHRQNVFEPTFQLAGVSIIPPSTRAGFCVIDYAGTFIEKADPTVTSPAIAGVKAVAPAEVPAPKAAPKAPASKATPKTSKRS